uniref:Uncharacterized protein n=1 Tax=Entomoneis paludosa TaxID=265537 RepID=A0A7S2YIJ8_9STRA|mmetsp:Transcript_34109/g.70970  ORF Transcript_34109/g.70970 Transcript_34109/m.70970 type:complete len:209 (+) Transcript_34109:165-791(+)
MKVFNTFLVVASASGAAAFAPIAASTRSSTSLHFFGGGSGADRLDEEWEKQQEILRNRRAPQAERDAYFEKIEERRAAASKEQQDKWAWQTKKYAKGEDPIDEWRKQRENGNISDLNDQYGEPEKMGGIPLPMASFGVGGEFGVGGKFDNGGRFDLRLPYADQGYVDDDSDVMGKIANFFGGGKKESVKEEPPAPPSEEPKKKGGWPW